VETLADTPKQEERRLNLRFIGFEAKEGKTNKELVQRLNIKLLQGQMKMQAKDVATMRQRPTTMWASALTTSVRLGAVLFKFATIEDC
jgi:hypothetical protein